MNKYLQNSKRSSNLELYRIICMLVIIAHHYVVNSGLMEHFDLNNITHNMLYLQLLASGGKTAINCFTLITGYYMLDKEWHIKRFLRLFSTILFYNITITAIFLITGYADLSKELIQGVIPFVFDVNSGYFGSVLFLYLIIPYLNLLMHKLGKRNAEYLILILIVVYSIIPTLIVSKETFNYISWLSIMYLIGAYIHLYPNRMFDSIHWSAAGTVISCGAMILSVVITDFTSGGGYWYMCNNANKLLPLLCSIFSFNLFKSIQLKYNPYINFYFPGCFWGVVYSCK